LPIAGHDAAAALLGRTAYVFGGGQAASTNTVVRVNTKTGAAALAAKLDEPLSDLGAAAVRDHAYLVGGYTGAQYASAVLRYDGGGKTTTVARLPTGLRYSGVAALGDRIYVAGGLTTSGETAAIYRVDPIAGTVRRIGRLPAPAAYGALVAYRSGALPDRRQDGHGSAGRNRPQNRPADRHDHRRGPPPARAAEPAAVALPDRIVVIGGENSNAVYELTPP
jgi:N-acetylneuraminic acid mutarotase